MNPHLTLAEAPGWRDILGLEALHPSLRSRAALQVRVREDHIGIATTFRRLVLVGVGAVRVADDKLERRHECRGPHRHGKHQACVCIEGIAEQAPGSDRGSVRRAASKRSIRASVFQGRCILRSEDLDRVIVMVRRVRLVLQKRRQ
jgi:hypothetical protein